MCRRHNLGSLLLRTVMWSAWSHCAIIDGDDVIEATTHGVRRRPLSALIADSSKWSIIEIPARDPERVLQAARDQIGKPYDYLGVIGIGFKRRWQDDDAWFCSELVAGAFSLAGEPLFKVKTWRITPRDVDIPVWTRLV